WQVGTAALAVVVSAGWWVALVTLWPADARPFIGGSQTNNIWDLILGYNGFGRLTGNEIGRVGGAPGPFSEGAGWLRLFQGELASEVSWLLPAALIAIVALLWATRRSPRTSQTRAHASLAIAFLPRLSLAAGPTSRRLLHGATAISALAVLLAVPAVGSIATAAEAHTGAIPTSQPVARDAGTLGGGQRFAGPGGGTFNGGALPFRGGGFGAPGLGQAPAGRPFGGPF